VCLCRSDDTVKGAKTNILDMEQNNMSGSSVTEFDAVAWMEANF